MSKQEQNIDEQVELYTTWLDDGRLLTPERAKIIKSFLERQHIALLKLQKAVSAEERIKQYFAGAAHG